MQLDTMQGVIVANGKLLSKHNKQQTTEKEC